MTAADASGATFVATVVVQEGDTLFKLARGVYGFADEQVLRRVLETNPGIKDPDTLFVGITVRFPAIRALGSGKSQLP
jgi:phage tail protein X